MLCGQTHQHPNHLNPAYVLRQREHFIEILPIARHQTQATAVVFNSIKYHHFILLNP